MTETETDGLPAASRGAAHHHQGTDVRLRSFRVSPGRTGQAIISLQLLWKGFTIYSPDIYEFHYTVKLDNFHDTFC